MRPISQHQIASSLEIGRGALIGIVIVFSRSAWLLVRHYCFTDTRDGCDLGARDRKSNLCDEVDSVHLGAISGGSRRDEVVLFYGGGQVAESHVCRADDR